MTTTCQDIVSRAQKFSVLNSALTSDRTEMLSRIRADQRELCTLIAATTRDFFQATASMASTAAASARAVDLGTLIAHGFPPLERILLVQLPTGIEVSQVDVLDVDAELAPRYTVRGYVLVEVKNEWATASSAAVTLTITYVYAPTDIDPSAALTQLVTIPDEWTDLLVLPLALYLVQKDPGRDPNEYARGEQMLSARREAFLEFLRHYGGVESRRFDIAAPLGTKK